MSKAPTKTNTPLRPTDRGRKFWMGVGIASLMMLSPILFYSYRLFSTETKSLDLGLFAVSSGGFANMQFFAHALFTKLLFTISFVIWYLTCRHWWRQALLVPLTMFLFQLSGVLNHQIQFIDEYDFWWSLPVVLPIIGLLVMLSRRLHYYRIAIDLKEQLEAEIKTAANPELYAEQENP